MENSGDLKSFAEDEMKEHSTTTLFSDLDKHSKSRKYNDVYRVETISLNDLLLKFDAPKLTDYLSIDTEGSEFEILLTVDFQTWNSRAITVKHNFSKTGKEFSTYLQKMDINRNLKRFLYGMIDILKDKIIF